MKRMILWLLALLMACLTMPAGALAELKLGDTAMIANCNEFASLREKSSTSAKRIAKLNRNTVVNVLGDGIDGFILVEHLGEIGYVHGDYLKLCENYENCEGETLELTDKQRYNINLFLSNFSEQRMPLYDEGNATNDWWSQDLDAFLLDFAVQHMLFNRPDAFETGDYNMFEMRLKMDDLDDVAWKYFKKRPSGFGMAPYSYSGDYYYLNPADKRVNGGFVSAYRVDPLGDSRYAVRFSLYGGDCGWEREDCRLTPGEAALKYDRSDIGMAVIVVDSDGKMGSLDDRSTWRLERWIVGSHGVQNEA